MRGSGRDLLDLLHGDAQLAGFVDEVVSDAASGERNDALGQEVEEVVVAPERSSPSVPIPVRLADDLVDAALFGPASGDALDARAAAVHEHHVGVLGADLVEALEDVGRIVHVLATGDGDEGSFGQVGLGLAVLACADEVTGVDGGGGELAGLAGVRSAPGPPCLAGRGQVVLGSGITHALEGVAAGGEVLRPVGDEFELAGLDLGTILFVLEVSEVGHEAVGCAVEALRLSVEHIDEAPEEAFAFIGKLSAVGADAVSEDAEAGVYGVESVILVPDIPGIELIVPRSSAEELRVFAERLHDGLTLVRNVLYGVHDSLLYGVKDAEVRD